MSSLPHHAGVTSSMHNMWLRTLNNYLNSVRPNTRRTRLPCFFYCCDCLYFQLQSLSSIGADEIPITNSCSEQDYFAPGKRLRTSAVRAFRTSRDVQFESVCGPKVRQRL